MYSSPWRNKGDNMYSPTSTVQDLVCVGLGPAQLALLIAAAEHPECRNWKILVLDRQAQFSWHSGMQSDHGEIQMSYLKDLVTLRNPLSEFSFINYLHQIGRLVTAANLNGYRPSRREYEHYLQWVADKLSVQTVRNAHVQQLIPTSGETLYVDYDDGLGTSSRVEARFVYAAVGKQPFIPDVFRVQSESITHTAQLRDSIAKTHLNTAKRVAVIGSGQSAVEALLLIHSTYPQLELYAIGRRHLFRAVDANPYVNQLYTWESELKFQEAESPWREAVRSELSNSNFGVADGALLQELARRDYERQVQGKLPIQRLGHTQITEVRVSDARVQLTLNQGHDRRPMTETFDHVFLATGYDAQVVKQLQSDAVLRSGRALFAGIQHEQAGLAEETITCLAQRAGSHLNKIVSTLSLDYSRI
jgi:L-ornithine N5-monooxygenase